MKPNRAWLLDCDGTIAINAEEIHERCVKETLQTVFSKAGMELPETFEAVWQAQLGKGIANFYNSFISTLPESEKIKVSEVCANSSVFEQQYEDYYCDLAVSGASGLEMRNGMREVIAKARANGEPVAVVSNAKQRVLECTLGAFGIDKLNVDLIAGIDTVMAAGYEPKPHPGSYIYALNTISLQRGTIFEAKNAIGMEDSRTGFDSLDAAGVGTIVYCKNHVNSQAPAMAHVIVGLEESLFARLSSKGGQSGGPAGGTDPSLNIH